jgi:hypothetical protein
MDSSRLVLTAMTMETALNLVWLGVTLAVLGLWRFRWAGSRRKPGHDVRLEAVAMICILALLFPVISLTDDLHPEVVPVEAASSKRSLCLLTASSAHAGSQVSSSSPQPFVFLNLRQSPAPIELAFAGYLSDFQAAQRLSADGSRPGRAPPSLT